MNFSIFLHRKMNRALLILESWMLYFSECSLRFPGGSHYSLQTLQKVNTLIVFISPSYLWSGLRGNKQVNKFSLWFLTYSVMSNVPVFLYIVFISFPINIYRIFPLLFPIYILFTEALGECHISQVWCSLSLSSLYFNWEVRRE